MASREELERALINADRAGDVEAAKILAAEIIKLGEAPKEPKPQAVKLGAEGLPDAMKAVIGDFHPLSQAGFGARGAVQNALINLSRVPGAPTTQAMLRDPKALEVKARPLTPDQETAVRVNRAAMEASAPAQAGNILTQIGMTMPFAGPIARGVTEAVGSALPSALRFIAPTAGGAAVGAAAPTLTEPTLPGESAQVKALEGAAGGAVADLAFRGAGRIAQPITQSEPVRRLLERGIVPTPGSAAGGLARDIEDKLTSVPLVGNLIQNARNRSLQEFNQAAFRQGTPPGQRISEIGREGVGQGKSAFDAAYGNIYQGNQIGLDDALAAGLQGAKTNTTIPLSSDEVAKFDAIIKREVLDRLAKGPVPTDDAKLVIEKNLGEAVAKAQGPLQDALRNARNVFRDAMGRSVGPEGASELRNIDKAYSAFADIKKAAKRAEAQGGVFTPNQLQRAAKPGELKRLADDAQDVLPGRVPNSGTADRLAAMAVYGGAATGAASPLFGAPFWAMLAAAPLAYSRPGTRFLLGDLIPGQQSLRQQLGLLAPVGAAGGGLLAEDR